MLAAIGTPRFSLFGLCLVRLRMVSLALVQLRRAPFRLESRGGFRSLRQRLAVPAMAGASSAAPSAPSAPALASVALALALRRLGGKHAAGFVILLADVSDLLDVAGFLDLFEL